MTALSVRAAGPADAAALLPLFAAFYGSHMESPTAEAAAEDLARSAGVDVVLMASVGERAVGFASLRILPQIETRHPHAELSDIYVDPAFRRQGVATALVQAVEDLARSRGAVHLYLLTDVANETARAFYRAAGFSDFARSMRKGLEVDP